MLQKALQFLDKHNEITLATCQGNLASPNSVATQPSSSELGWPSQLRPVPKLRIFQIMKREGNILYFATSSKKAVWQELQENPNVELLAYADNVSVRCSGMVNFYINNDTKQWIYDHNDVLSCLYTSYAQLEYFCLPIADLDYFDLNPTPPVNLHFDLMAGTMNNGFVGERYS